MFAFSWVRGIARQSGPSAVIRDGSGVRVTTGLFQAADRQVWADVYARRSPV
jgi:TolB-like protein